MASGGAKVAPATFEPRRYTRTSRSGSPRDAPRRADRLRAGDGADGRRGIRGVRGWAAPPAGGQPFYDGVQFLVTGRSFFGPSGSRRCSPPRNLSYLPTADWLWAELARPGSPLAPRPAGSRQPVSVEDALRDKVDGIVRDEVTAVATATARALAAATGWRVAWTGTVLVVPAFGDPIAGGLLTWGRGRGRANAYDLLLLVPVQWGGTVGGAAVGAAGRPPRAAGRGDDPARPERVLALRTSTARGCSRSGGAARPARRPRGGGPPGAGARPGVRARGAVVDWPDEDAPAVSHWAGNLGARPGSARGWRPR